MRKNFFQIDFFRQKGKTYFLEVLFPFLYDKENRRDFGEN